MYISENYTFKMFLQKLGSFHSPVACSQLILVLSHLCCIVYKLETCDECSIKLVSNIKVQHLRARKLKDSKNVRYYGQK